MTQPEFLQILFDGIGFNRAERNEYLSREVARPIKFLDELRTHEASRIIDELKARRDRNKQPREEE